MSWKAVALGIPNTGSFTWNTQNFPDAAFGMLRVFASDTAGRMYAMGESGAYFTVNNSAGGPPFVRIMSGGFDSSKVVTQPETNAALLLGEPAWGTVLVNLSYRVNSSGPYVPIEMFVAHSDTVSQSHTIHLEDLPNSDSLQIKVTASNGAGVYSDSTVPFRKNTARPVFPPGRTQFAGLAQVPIRICIQDSAHVRPDTYVISFNDTAYNQLKTFSVFDRTRGTSLASNVPFTPGIESTPFDGLTLYSGDTLTAPDTSRSRWNHTLSGVAWNLSLSGPATLSPSNPTAYRQPNDYMIVFHGGSADTTVPLDLNIGYTLPAVTVPFRVTNMRTHKKVKIAGYAESIAAQMFFIENVGGVERPTWELFIYSLPAASFPVAGDTLFVYTRKGLSIYDTLTVSGFLLSIAPKGGVPVAYTLSQNYPNPFNPSTRIEYALPAQSQVTLKVYNILGQVVATLVDGVETAGNHAVEWRGASDGGIILASGVYFCRIEARGVSGGTSAFTQTMKMLYLK